MSLKKPFLLFSVLLIALGSIFSVNVSKAFADSFSGDPNTKVTGWAFDESIDGYLPTEQIKAVDDPTRFAYCLEPGKHSPNNVDMPSSGQMSDKVYRILSYGYPNASASDLGVSSKAKAHYATQMAVWIAVGEVKESNITYSDSSIEKAVKALLNKAETKSDTQDVNVTVTPENAKASVKGNYLVTEPFTVKSSATGTYTVSLSNSPENTVVTDINGKQKNTFNANEQFKIQLPKNTPTNKIKVIVKTELNKLVSMKYNSDGTYQNIVSLKEVKKNMEVGVSASWETAGAIQIVKSTDDKKPLSGVSFDIKNAAGNKVMTVTTDKEGKAYAPNLPIGKYTAVETKTAEGFVLDSTPKTVTVNADETTVVSFTNKKIRGEVQVFKTDEDHKPLQGVEFSIFNSKGIKLTSAVTDKNGKAAFKNLPYGKYSVKETKAQEGFIANQSKHSVNISKDGEIQTLNIQNQKIRGNVELTKVDTQDKKNTLEDATFDLLNEEGKKIGEYQTDKNGKLLVHGLEYGKYSFVEKAAPKGYVLNTDPISFEIKENEKTVKLQAENKMITGSLEITKTDVANGNTRIKGAEFTIFNEKGEIVTKGKTDKNGIARFDNLPYGKYTYKETIAPEGYLINEETFTFEIKENGQIIKHTVADEKEKVALAPVFGKKNDTISVVEKDTGHVEKTTEVIQPAEKQDTGHVEKPVKGNELPNTGNPNQYRALMIGLSLIIIGAGLLFLKRKKTQTENK
ncbi:SpaA isopeptide-forming pilin-related protein [Bacillus subtilis]|uniref:SpaA isopeptide-forming pilin-related protein n=1 Tax=Bacillus subtilis TaxID=1423 RepID=UPI002041480C|nr:SpaA isopeptide-forming pilin-related protein [Bacillus subtilis]MCM3191267.1 SpaA isopeptide-forming pilin-related protein [Bacillus subtilis]